MRFSCNFMSYNYSDREIHQIHRQWCGSKEKSNQERIFRPYILAGTILSMYEVWNKGYYKASVNLGRSSTFCCKSQQAKEFFTATPFGAAL